MSGSTMELGHKNVVSEWVNKGTKVNPNPVMGDRIEMSRYLGIYQHWALYLGNDIVVNFTGVDNPATKTKSDKVKILQSNLYETIGDSPARINNGDDATYFKPATRDDITRRIQYFVDNWPGYNVGSNNCEHFVNYCRYEKRFSKQTGVEYSRLYNPSVHSGASLGASGASDLKTKWVSRGKKLTHVPVLGDQIEMNRGAFCHWAVYLGDDIVAEFTPKNSNPISKLKIKHRHLYETIGDSQARINNKNDAKYFKPGTRADVARRLKHYLITWPDYNFVTNNCEHFANYCRYEKRFSKQTHVTYPRAKQASVAGASAFQCLIRPSCKTSIMSEFQHL